MHKLLVLTTGGTIDKVYFDAKSAYEVGEPVVASVLKAMNVSLDFEIEQVCKKDSLEITDEDRQSILERVRASDAEYILVTHGTDTMVDTAKYIGPQTDKVVVFTGAMQPAVFRETDGIFNIGVAMGVLSAAKPGVYIAMNGRCFTPDTVYKNYVTRRFEAIEGNTEGEPND